MEDPRKTGLKNGLRQLNIEQLKRVINYKKEMVLDSYNYENGKFCPLAIAVELDKQIEEPTHEKVFNELTKMGYKVYNTRGIKGEFYTDNRLEDLLEAANEVMEEKINKGQREPEIRRLKSDRRYFDRRAANNQRQDTQCLKCKKDLEESATSLLCGKCSLPDIVA